MLILIPTYRRCSNNEAQTLKWLPPSVAATLIVRAHEQQPYAKLLKELKKPWEVHSIPEGAVNGIADTRNYILDIARKLGKTKVCMVDDDLRFLVRGKLPGNDVHLRNCSDVDVEEMFRWLDTSLDKYAHAAVSMREGNNRVPGINAYVEATRGIRIVAYNLNMIGSCRFRTEVEGREDLDMTLQLLRQGLPNVVTYHWSQGQRSTQAPGGMSDSRSLDMIHQSAVKLQELHPGVVSLRSTSNVSGALAGERTEVTIYWKRALANGLAARNGLLSS